MLSFSLEPTDNKRGVTARPPAAFGAVKLTDARLASAGKKARLAATVWPRNRFMYTRASTLPACERAALS